MRLNICVVVILASAAATGRAAAQTPVEPPAQWEVKIGAAFVGTSGNSDTKSTGANFDARRDWDVWRIESSASAVATSDKGVTTAEQFLGAVRAKRDITKVVSATTGIKLERDQLSGLNFRSLLDGGFAYAIVKRKEWTLDGLTALVWSHETRTINETLDEAEGELEIKSKYLFGSSGETTQRITYFPNFTTATAYRAEGELTVQASMNKRLALKIGFLWRYAHDPVPGFMRSDTTTTASIVVRWRAATAAPAP